MTDYQVKLTILVRADTPNEAHDTVIRRMNKWYNEGQEHQGSLRWWFSPILVNPKKPSHE